MKTFNAANYTLPDHTNPTEQITIDIFAYPGNDYIRIFKRPSSIENALRELKVSSVIRPFDNWLMLPYGQSWESPGYIDTLQSKHRSINVERLETFSKQYNVSLFWMSPEFYVEKYQRFYEKEYPNGVTNVLPEYDDHTVQRLRHMIYFKRQELNETETSFVSGIGKKLVHGYGITEKQRDFIRNIFAKYNVDESQHITNDYSFVTIDNGDFKFSF